MSHGSIDDILARINRLEQSSASRADENPSAPSEPENTEQAEAEPEVSENTEDPAGFQTIQPGFDDEQGQTEEDAAASEILSSDTFRDDDESPADEDVVDEIEEPEPEPEPLSERDMQAPVMKIGKQGFEEVNVARPLPSDERLCAYAARIFGTSCRGARADSRSPIRRVKQATPLRPHRQATASSTLAPATPATTG